jgi:DNA polymerase elongation subunit (family B)
MNKYYENVKESKIFMKDMYSGKNEYFEWVYNKFIELLGEYEINTQCIYGDTDSVFFKLNLKKNGEIDISKKSLEISIQVGIIGTAILNHTLEYPQGLAYEKTYWPFVIISKKRYVGSMYTENPNDEPYQKSMGLVTKRRDNANIVKIVVGGLINIILSSRNSLDAVNFVKSQLRNIISSNNNDNIENFIISKTLKDKDAYKNWKSMAHVVLAERMGDRDPGSKPQSNDRIQYVYVQVDEKKIKLQGDRVEHPNYVIENNLKIDSIFYIQKQIMKPTIQFLELIIKNPAKLFKSYMIIEENKRNGILPIKQLLSENKCLNPVNLMTFKSEFLFKNDNSSASFVSNKFNQKYKQNRISRLKTKI